MSTQTLTLTGLAADRPTQGRITQDSARTSIAILNRYLELAADSRNQDAIDAVATAIYNLWAYGHELALEQAGL